MQTGTDQTQFARELHAAGQEADLRDTFPKRASLGEAGNKAQAEKKEPGEPSATCLAVVPSVALPQQTPPVSLDLSLDKGAKNFGSKVTDREVTGAAGTAQGEYAASATTPLSAMIQQTQPIQPGDPGDCSGVKPQPVDTGRLPAQPGPDVTPDPHAVNGVASPEMLQPSSEELTVAVRLKPQSGTSQAAGIVSKATPVKEPRRVDVDEAPPVQPVRNSSFQAAAWNGQDVPTSAGPHQGLEKSNTSPEHLDVAPVVAERPAKAVEPLRNLSIQVGQGNQEKVELRVSERAGEVRVAVRTADVGLQNGLRQSLPELVHRLEGQGFRTDAWRPSGVVSATTPLTETRQSSPDFQGGDSQAKQGWSQQERGQHNHNQSDRPQWVEELEGNLAGDG